MQRTILIVMAFVGLLTQDLLAGDSYPLGLKLIGQNAKTDVDSVSRIMAIDDHTVLTDGGSVYDLSDPKTPKRVAVSGFTGVDLKRVGTTGYLAAGRSGLTIVDVQNPAQLVRLGGYRSGGDARAVDVLGTFAYVASADGGLRVIDVANPGRTDQAGQYPSSLSETLVANDMVIRNNLAYFAAGADTLEILRITSPTSIQRVGGLRGGLNTSWIDWLGNHILLAGEMGGLLVADVSTPAAPVILGEYSPPAEAADFWYGIVIVQNLCYVAAGYDGILIVDCSNPAQPKLAGAYKPIAPIISVSALAGHIIASHGASGFSVLEPVSNTAAAPRIVSQPKSITVALGTPARLEVQAEPAAELNYQWYFGAAPISGATGQALEFSAAAQAQEGNYSVIVANDSGAVQSDAAKLTVVLPPDIYNQPSSTIALEGETVTLHVSAINGALEYQWYKDGAEIPAAVGSTLTLGPITPAKAGAYAVRVRNIAGSATSSTATITVRPTLAVRAVGRWPATPDYEFVDQVRVVGGIAYVTQRAAGLQVLDITDPANPRRIAGYFGSGNATRFQIVSNILYLADGNVGGLTALDISNPAQPVRLGKIQTGSSVNDVRVVGNLAYLAAGVKGIAIVDIRQPEAMKLIGSYPDTYGAVGIDVSSNWVFVADSNGGLLIFDATDPAKPLPVTQYDKPSFGTYSITDIQVAGKHAYIPRTFDGFSIVDVSNPRNPTSVAYETGYSRTVHVIGDYAYVGRLDVGFRIFDVSTPQRPLMVTQLDTPGEVADIDAAGNLLLVADGKNGLLLFQITTSANSQTPTVAIERLANSSALRIHLPSDSPAVLNRSTDLRTWSPILTNQPAAGTAEFLIDPKTGPAAAYFRVSQ